MYWGLITPLLSAQASFRVLDAKDRTPFEIYDKAKSPLAWFICYRQKNLFEGKKDDTLFDAFMNAKIPGSDILTYLIDSIPKEELDEENGLGTALSAIVDYILAYPDESKHPLPLKSALIKLLDKGASVKCKTHNTLIHKILSEKTTMDLDLFKKLAERANVEKILDNPDTFGNTPLHQSSAHLEYAKPLILAGASLEIQNDSGTPALQKIAKKLSIDELKTFLDIQQVKEKINVQNKKGKTLLHYFTAKRDCARVELLLDHGALTTIEDSEGRTSLRVAMSSARANIHTLEAMIKKLGPDYKDAEGNTFIHLAIKYKASSDMIRSIVRTPGIIFSKNNQGYTPFELAIRLEYLPFFDLDSDMSKPIDDRGNTILHTIPFLPCSFSFKQQLISLLINRGCDPNVVNNDGIRAMDLLIQNGLIGKPPAEPEPAKDIDDGELSVAKAYEILGLPHNSPWEEIKKAKHNLNKQLHSDRTKTADSERIKEINAACDRLARYFDKK